MTESKGVLNSKFSNHRISYNSFRIRNYKNLRILQMCLTSTSEKKLMILTNLPGTD